MNMARTIPPMAAPGLFGPAERVFGAESPTGSRAESATGDRAAPIHLQVTTLPRALQEALIDANCLAGTADGQFGAKSQAALAAFYANADPALGLTPKTEIGVAVWKDLHQVMGKSPVEVCPEAAKPAPKAQAPAKVSAPKAQAPAKQPATPKPAAKPAKPAGDGGCTGKLTASQMAACAG